MSLEKYFLIAVPFHIQKPDKPTIGMNTNLTSKADIGVWAKGA
jgi:hypothetical protein